MHNAQWSRQGKRAGNFVHTVRNQKDAPLVADFFDLGFCYRELNRYMSALIAGNSPFPHLGANIVGPPCRLHEQHDVTLSGGNVLKPRLPLVRVPGMFLQHCSHFVDALRVLLLALDSAVSATHFFTPHTRQRNTASRNTRESTTKAQPLRERSSGGSITRQTSKTFPPKSFFCDIKPNAQEVHHHRSLGISRVAVHL